MLQDARKGQRRGGCRGGGGTEWPRSEGPQRMGKGVSHPWEQQVASSTLPHLPVSSYPLPSHLRVLLLLFASSLAKKMSCERNECAFTSDRSEQVVISTARCGYEAGTLSLFPSSSSRKHTFLPYHQYIVLFSRYGAANIITNRCIVSSPQQGIKETESSSLRRFLLPSRIIFIILDNISVPTRLRAGALSLTAKTSFLSCLFSPLHDEDTPYRPI